MMTEVLNNSATSTREQNDEGPTKKTFLEVNITNPKTNGLVERYTDYEIIVKTNMKIFKLKESTVRRRYSDFIWLKNEIEKHTHIKFPPLPSKAWTRLLPLRTDDGLFDEAFIEQRRQGLEKFLQTVTKHPLALSEYCLHMFLQMPTIDINYTPGKVLSNNEH